jgi:hypothetical protein
MNQSINSSQKKIEKVEPSPKQQQKDSRNLQSARNSMPSGKSSKINPNDSSFAMDNKNKLNQSKISRSGASPTKKEDQSMYSNYELFNQGVTRPGDEMKDNNKWREIVFKIKLTDKEYELLLKEKSKGLHI